MSYKLNTKVEKLLFVLGAHQSGASQMTRFITSHDYDLPSDQSPLQSIAGIHLRFLTDIGSHWSDPCPLPRGVFKGNQASLAVNSIHDLLEREHHSSVVITDPCLCRLLPLWTEALTGFEGDIKALEIVRNPMSGPGSLRRQAEIDGDSPAEIGSGEHRDLLWWRQVSEARHHVQGLEFLTVPFEHLKHDQPGKLGHVYTFLGISNPDPSGKIAANHHFSGTIAPSRNPQTDSVLFLFSTYLHLIGSKKPVPEPDGDIPAPPCVPSHPWPEDMYRAVSAASLKHLSGSTPHPPEAHSVLIQSDSNREKRPIDVLFISDKPAWPSHIYRVKNPVDALNRNGFSAVWVDKKYIINEPEFLDHAVRVIIHRLDWGPDFQKIVQECRKKHIPVGYDLDDLLFIPELIACGARDAVTRLGPHEVQRWMQRSKDFQRCIREADFFIGATELLTEKARPFNQDCRSIFNGFSPENLSMAELANSHLNSNDKEAVSIGYASGTATHQADFNVVAETIWDLMIEEPGLSLTIVGTLEWESRPPAELEKRISTRPLVPHVNLPFELAQFDINIIPLERNDFCDGKSPLKFFEAGLVNVPTVATRNPTYESIEKISQACLLADDPAGWNEHLRRLACDPTQRKHLGGIARRTAVQKFHCDLTVELYEGLPAKAE